MKKSLMFIGVAMALAGCSGGSGHNNNGGGSGGQAETETGVFLDSAVAGIGYRTETQSGVTNAAGEYDYLPGESVTFFIGDLEFPPVTASGVVTPADIGGEASSVTAINIMQILQTLDQDGDPSNGIRIHPGAEAAFTGVGAGLDVTSATFDNEVATTLNNLNGGLTLVSEEAALAHFAETQTQQLIGSWLYSEGHGKRNILSFIDESHYILFHEHADTEGGQQAAGSAEYGTFNWDLASGTFDIDVISASDEDGGLDDGTGSGSFQVSLSGDALTFDEEFAFIRIVNDSNDLVGGWRLDEEDIDNINILTILSASEYAIVHTNNLESYQGQQEQALSGEFGSYRFSGGEFTVQSASVDTDGPGGLYDASGSHFSGTLTVTPGVSLEFGAGSDDAFTLQALVPGERDINLNGTWSVTESYDVCPNELTVDYSTLTVTFGNGEASYEEDYIDEITFDSGAGSTCSASANGEESDVGSEPFEGDGVFTASTLKAFLNDGGDLLRVSINSDDQLTIVYVFQAVPQGGGEEIDVQVTQTWTRQVLQ